MSGGRLPKVASFAFDLELEDSVAAEVQREELISCTDTLRALLQPTSQAGLQLSRDVQRMEATQPDALANALASLGYSVKLRRAMGGGSGRSCLENLRHTFLSVVACPGANQETYIVDPGFADQFMTAKTTPRYLAIVSCLSETPLVLRQERISSLVTYLCTELATAFRQTNTVLPPWRTADSMLSKWQPRNVIDESVEQDAARCEAMKASKASAVDPAPAEAQKESGSRVNFRRIIPMVMEPIKVYRGFSGWGHVLMR